MKRLELHWQILIGLILGILYGYFLPGHVKYVDWLGELFIRALKMIIVPLIVASLISGITNIGSSKSLGRLGLKTLGYYLMTSTLAIITGLILVNLIEPGVGASLGLTEEVEQLEAAKGKSMRDTLINIIPENIVQALSNTEMLSIIFFSILFGFFITRINKNSRDFMINFFNSAFEVMMKLTMFIIRFTPLGIFGIVAGVVAEESNNLAELAGRMGWYMITVIGALFIHSSIIMPVLLRTLGRSNPSRHFKYMRSVLLTAFSTSSSGATLSFTLNAVENDVGVSNKVTSFTLPLGATINMDGTALYECVAAMFIAQAYGIDMAFGQQVIVVATALLASIGAAGIPMAGLVMISIILTAVGLPLEGVGLILAVDRILDMFRTSVNVWSDSCGAVIIGKSEGEELNI